MYLDASAIVTVLLKKPGWRNVALRVEDHRTKLITSPISVYEATISIAGPNASEIDFEDARVIVRDFLNEAGVKEVVISDAQTKCAMKIYSDQIANGSKAPPDMNEAFILGTAKAFRSKILYTNERFSDR